MNKKQPRMGLTSQEYYQLITEKINQGMRRTDIAKECGVKPAAITNFLRNNGLPNATLERQKLIQFHQSRGLTPKQIAKEINLDVCTVHKYMVKKSTETIEVFGITYRRYGDSNLFCSSDGKVIKKFENAITVPAVTQNPMKFLAIGEVPLARIIATCWIRQPLAGEYVYHINGDIKDNRLINLAIGSPKDKIQNSISRGTHISCA